MEILIFLPIYIVLVTFFLTVNAQTTGLNILTDTTKISEKDIVNNSRRSSQQNERVELQENKDRVDQNLLHILSSSRRELKENNSTSKSTQVPFNLVIDTKPRTIPIKIPLIMKTGNVKPAPAHYLRLKGNTDRRNSKTQSQNASSSNKQTSRKSVAIKDKVKSKSTNKSSRKHKSKNSKFFEDTGDSYDTPLRKELKSVKPKKFKKIKNNHDSSTKLKPEKETDNELNCTRHETRKLETVCDCDKTINIENETHSVLISKLPLSTQYEIKSNEANESLDKNLQEYVPKEKPLTLPHNELEIIPAPISENTTVAVIAIDDYTQDAVNLSDNKYIETAGNEIPIASVNPETELPEVITIKDHNYQEIEERRLPSQDPEQITVDEYNNINGPWATETFNPVSIHSYDTYIPNYQTAYSDYLKYMAENNSPIYNEGNFYPRSNIIDPMNTYAPEEQILSSPVKEVVHDIYGPNLGYQSNTINVRPENSVGRIWRTWKDTEIRLNRPKYASNKPFQLRRNSIGMIYGEHSAKMPSILRLQPVSPGAYYNNLNNIWPHPNSGQLNRYLL